MTTSPLIVEVFVPPDAYPGSVCGPIDVFTEATRRSPGHADYAVRLLAEEPGAIRLASGVRILSDRSIHDSGAPADTLLVAGSRQLVEQRPSPVLVDRIRRRSAEVRRYGAIGPGAFLLGEAGLLDGRHVTTHWEFVAALASRYPSAMVEPDRIFVRDGPLFTAAGLSAATDLALSLVEEDFGRDLALEVARFLVVYLKRPGGHPQISAQLAAQMATRSPIQHVQEWVRDHPKACLSVPELARRAVMSERNFTRVFRQETGTTPAAFVEATRVDIARRLLEETGLPLQRIAASCGLSGLHALRRAFLRRLGVSPTAYRLRFRPAYRDGRASSCEK